MKMIPGLLCTTCGKIVQEFVFDKYPAPEVIRCDSCKSEASTSIKVVEVPLDYFKNEKEKFLTKEEMVELLI